MKEKYIIPIIKIVQLSTDANIAQFIVSSKSIGEEEGEAKSGFFEEEDEEAFDSSEEKPWGEVSY